MTVKQCSKCFGQGWYYELIRVDRTQEAFTGGEIPSQMDFPTERKVCGCDAGNKWYRAGSDLEVEHD